MRKRIAFTIALFLLMVGPLHAAAMDVFAHEEHGMVQGMGCQGGACEADGDPAAAAAACASHCLRAAQDAVLPAAEGPLRTSIAIVFALVAVMAALAAADAAGRGSDDGLRKMLVRRRLASVVLRN